MAAFSTKQIESLMNKYENLKVRTANAAKKAEAKATDVLAAAEVVGGAAVGQYVSHRVGDNDGNVRMFGAEIPVDLLSGSILTVLGLFDALGKPSRDFQNIGVGIVAGWVGKKSAGLGTSARHEGRLLGENYAVVGDEAPYGIVGAGPAYAIGRQTADERLAAEMAASY